MIDNDPPINGHRSKKKKDRLQNVDETKRGKKERRRREDALEIPTGLTDETDETSPRLSVPASLSLFLCIKVTNKITPRTRDTRSRVQFFTVRPARRFPKGRSQIFASLLFYDGALSRLGLSVYYDPLPIGTKIRPCLHILPISNSSKNSSKFVRNCLS